MAHILIPEAEDLLDKELACLDHGFVRLVDYMGGDASIVQAARVSYGEGTKKVSEDAGLIRYLMRHHHTTPFEMVELKFHCKMPIFVARQWIRHRTANVNEYSLRYSEALNEFYFPEPEVIKYQSSLNKQGREEDVPVEIQARVLEILKEGALRDYAGYQEMNEAGIARELARIGLPLSLYTQWYWKNDLHNIFRFLGLRLDDHAQYEIRVYAQAMAQCVKAVAPVAYHAFEDYWQNALSFSQPELAVLTRLLQHTTLDEALEGTELGKREVREFTDKLSTFYTPPPKEAAE